jgi:hypothetical protein
MYRNQKKFREDLSTLTYIICMCKKSQSALRPPKNVFKLGFIVFNEANNKLI